MNLYYSRLDMALSAACHGHIHFKQTNSMDASGGLTVHVDKYNFQTPTFTSDPWVVNFGCLGGQDHDRATVKTCNGRRHNVF